MLLAQVATSVASGPSNPFAILTFIAAPAVLTNASSVLTLGTSNRFGRNVDRSRQIIKILDGLIGDASAIVEERAMYRQLLAWLDRRMQMLMRAMSLFYFAIGCFAAGSLTSLLGAILASTEHPYVIRTVLAIAFAVGVAGLSGLIYGGILLVRETRLALATIREEMRFYRSRFTPEPLNHPPA